VENINLPLYSFFVVFMLSEKVDYDLILVRYGELSLKSRYVRRYFENMLVRNIKNVFRRHGLSCRVEREWGRIYVFTDNVSSGVDLLRRVFGVVSVSPAFRTVSSMDSVSKLAVGVSKKFLCGDMSFAVRVTRTGCHVFTSRDVAVRVGRDVAAVTGARVDLDRPDFELFIEVRDDVSFLFTEKIVCVGGLPVGTQGRVLVLVDSFYSILAAWYMMRRGCDVVFVVVDDSFLSCLDSFLSKWNMESKIISANVSCRVDLYSMLDRFFLDEGCDAIVTGYSMYMHSDDVLSSIMLLKKHVGHLFLHPLICFDREMMDQKLREIGVLV